MKEGEEEEEEEREECDDRVEIWDLRERDIERGPHMHSQFTKVNK